jgi:hypothetical protein
MINRDPRCVYVADSLGLADVIALWLTDQGIPAQVMDAATLGGHEGLTWLSRTGVSGRGIEVWVIDPGEVSRAQLLLEEHQADLAADAADRANSSETVEVICEDCGESNTFPGSERGKVQNCRQCGVYMDVPSDLDGWMDAEGEEEPGEGA